MIGGGTATLAVQRILSSSLGPAFLLPVGLAGGSTYPFRPQAWRRRGRVWWRRHAKLLCAVRRGFAEFRLAIGFWFTVLFACKRSQRRGFRVVRVGVQMLVDGVGRGWGSRLWLLGWRGE